MTYEIIENSYPDLAEDTKKDPRFQMILLTLQVGSAQMVNDGTFDQKRFTGMVKTCPGCPKAACLSPETFKAILTKTSTETMFVITLSGHLSRGYNSTAMAKKLYRREMVEKGVAKQAKKVAVIDSFSASSGEPNIAFFIQNLCGSGLGLDEVVEKTLAYRGGMNTYFVLESLDTLRKNGRLSGLQTFFAIALNIKPVMDADTGTVIELGQTGGTNGTLHGMYDIAVKEAVGAAGKIVVVCHVNNPERAECIKSKLAKRVRFRKIMVTDAAGTTTVYANGGGIVLVV